MRGVRAFLAAAGLAASAAVAGAEEPPKPRSELTFEAATARPDDLPAGVRIVAGTRCASREATEFFLDPGYAGSLDCPPLRKHYLSFEGAGGVSGSVLLFEYAGAVPSFIQRVLARSLWGDGRRGAKRPDEVVVHGRFLWIVSFPYCDPTAEWVKARLRSRFGVPARRTRPELAEVERKLWQIAERGGPKEGLAAIDAAGGGAADWAIGSYLRGEFSMSVKDGAAAEAAYRRARDLHESLTDPLPANLAWAALDGVGNALLLQKRYDEAAGVLARSKEEGRAIRLENDETPHTAYALACAQARLGKWGDALRELTDAVDGDRRWFRLALTDEALAEARKRPEFRVLLELDPPRPAPVPPKPAAPSRPAEPIAFDALLIQAAELPAGWSLVEGSQCVSTSAHSFFVTPDPGKIVGRHAGPGSSAGALPAAVEPVRKACQSIVRPDGSAGSVLLFEYAEDVDRGILGFLRGYVWGKDGPTDRNPEEILPEGRYLCVLSFPRGDAGGEWVKERLRRRFRIPAPRTRRELGPAVARIASALESGDVDLGLRLLDARAALLADCSLAWHLRGELCARKQDPAGAEAAHRRAIDLHDALVDPLPDPAVWASLDGLGIALLQRKKVEEARKTLVRAKAFAAERRIEDSSVSTYNLACALALLRKYDEALAELAAAIAARPAWKASAREDADFAEARKRPDFQALLSE